MMTHWARIESGVVIETTDINPTGRFYPALIWVPCPDDVAQNWTFDGIEFTAPILA